MKAASHLRADGFLAVIAAVVAAVIAAALLGAATDATAQGRDPMQAPAAAQPPAAAGSSPPRAQTEPGRHLVTLDGRRYVVVGARRYGVGDRLGEARIERIEDTAVVVRDSGGLRRLALHTGVIKRPVPEARLAAPNRR